MQMNRTRRVQRVHLAKPLVGRLGSIPVVLVDVSTLGARIEHTTPMQAGGKARLNFVWDDEEMSMECRIVRSRLERFSVGADGLTVYHSGLEFDQMDPAVRTRLKSMIGQYIARALEEQKLNARGVLPQHDLQKMPIFRYGGQLAANPNDVAQAVGSAQLPTARIQKESGYICYHLEGRTWRKKRTHDPGQPTEGFTISATEDPGQAELLCDAYLSSDQDGRKMIQLFAQLSIMEGEGIAPGRFKP